jgi:hypothetical protein
VLICISEERFRLDAEGIGQLADRGRPRLVLARFDPVDRV